MIQSNVNIVVHPLLQKTLLLPYEYEVEPCRAHVSDVVEDLAGR
jgi:hypothetical protein